MRKILRVINRRRCERDFILRSREVPRRVRIMGIGRTQEESWTKAAPSTGHVSMQRAHVIMLRPQMYGRRKVMATTIMPDANLTSSTTALCGLIRA